MFIPSEIESIIYYYFDGDAISIYDALIERMASLKEDITSLTFTLTESELFQTFNDQDKISETNWTAWSDNWVYFPMYHRWSICWIGFAPRNPCQYKSPANDGTGL